MIIYLNGTSSCGKTTVSKALQKLLPSAQVLSADVFGEQFEQTVDKSLPDYQRIQVLHEAAVVAVKQASNDSERHQAFEQFQDLLENDPLPKNCDPDLAMYDHLFALYQASSAPIIVDDLIVSDYLFRAFLKQFREASVYLVAIVCDEAILAQREQARGDRLIGSAAFWQRQVRDKKHDIVVDSSQLSPEHCAAAIIQMIERTPAAKAMQENYERYYEE